MKLYFFCSAYLLFISSAFILSHDYQIMDKCPQRMINFGKTGQIMESKGFPNFITKKIAFNEYNLQRPLMETSVLLHFTAKSYSNITTLTHLSIKKKQLLLGMPRMVSDLSDFLSKVKSSSELRASMALSICKSVNKIHKLGIVHNDLNSANVLVDKTNNVILSDFGDSELYGNLNEDQQIDKWSKLLIEEKMKLEELINEVVGADGDMQSVFRNCYSV